VTRLYHLSGSSHPTLDHLIEHSPVTNNSSEAKPSMPPTEAQVVELDMVVGWCGGGDCPTIYRTDRESFVVQGYEFDPAEAGVELPAGERMIEIPTELLAEFGRLAPSALGSGGPMGSVT
jgi:hypothetical protein